MAQQPREYLRWDLLDRDKDPIPWDPAEARSLKDFYERLADAAETAGREVRRLDRGSLGEGKTVEVLQELVEELPKYLDKAHDAYEAGYKALETWADALETARRRSASVARLASTAYHGLEDKDEWKDGDDPLRASHISDLNAVLTEMDRVADDTERALEEAKQGSPRKLWGWLDKIVTWIEENPLIYAVIMIVAGLAAIFIPGLGIALAIAALALATANLHREGKLGFNLETLTTLGMEALSLVPGGALLRGASGLGRVASRATGPMGRGVRSAATAVRSTSAVQRVGSRVGSMRSGYQSLRNTRTSVNIAHSVVRDTASGMAASIVTQVGADPGNWQQIISPGSLANEALGAFATNALGSGVGAVKENHGLGPLGGGPSGTGTYTGGSDPDGTPVTTLDHTSPSGEDVSIQIRPDEVTVGDTSVRPSGDGFQVSGADGASVSASRGGDGSLDLTGPGGTPGPSFGGDGITVPTGDGNVTVSHTGGTPGISTPDGLSVQGPSGAGEPVQITQPRGAVDLDFGDGGPRISRPETGVDGGSNPTIRVEDPAGGTRTEFGNDGYRVDGEGGSTQGYDRGTDNATLRTDDVRVDAGPDSVRVVDETRGVDIAQRADGSADGRGAGSTAVVRPDGSAEIRTDNPSLSPRAVQDADGHVRIDGDGGIRGSDAWPGQVRTEDGTGVVLSDRGGDTHVQVWHADGTRRSYDLDGTPHGGHPPLPRDPSTGEPYVLTGGTRVAVTPGTGTSPALRMDTPQGWSVTTSTRGDVSLRAPADARGDALRIGRGADGTTGIGTDLHGVGGGPDGMTAHGPGGVRAGSDRDGSHVSDGTTRTDVRRGESSGLGRAETTRENAPGRPIASQGNDGSRVTTSDGVTVRTDEGGRITTDVPADGAPRTIRNGDRTIDAGPDGVGLRGPSPDSPGTVPLRMGETAGDAGHVPPGWRVTADGEGGMTGSTHPDHRIEADGSGRAEFRNGDLSGTRSASGRTNVSDGNGVTVQDARGGVRVDTGEGHPDLRITPDHVQVVNPDGQQQRVDPTVPGGRPEGAGGDGTPASVRSQPVRAAGQEIAWQLTKNVLNLSFGFAVDASRQTMQDLLGHLGVEAEWLTAFMTDIDDPKYWVQVGCQLAVAVPKAGHEGRMAHEGDLPDAFGTGLLLESAHQAGRNNLRDDVMGELEEQEKEEQREAETRDRLKEDVRARLEVLDMMFSQDMVDEFAREHPDPTLSERERVAAVIEAATDERDRLRRELKELENG
ncbi:RHS repeat domain-containing protein [Nocardiopsis lambiniae]|uniref:WXG100 family type VII secretion target n=1 Tax=Nocardiopsis lambiniae TaxID=3075539 RepID=A0ABU2M634_9ACTN|nr:hypothetical protein [Nocardiopsis sp. DSM 44743]MDT0328129.1 hypothetical protein [Nocardiopsis sp. DSM 44743]